VDRSARNNAVIMFVELDEETCRFFERGIALRKQLESEMQGGFNLLIAQNSLEGQWELDLSKKQLVRKDAQG
jgi:hypothetical protein